MAKPPKTAAADQALDKLAAELDAPKSSAAESILRDQFAMHAMGAIIMGIVSRGGPSALDVAYGDDELLGAAYRCADMAMRMRAKL